MSSDITDDFKFTDEFTVISNLLSKNIQFSIPESSYKIISEPKDSSSIYNELDYEILPIMPFSKYNIPYWIKVSLHSITYKKNKNIICMHIENNCNQNSSLPGKKAILYSHENNTDLIRLLPFLIDLSVQNKCNIISYDYRGYGCSSSKSKERNFISSYEYTMNYALNYLNYKIENILLMGRDIGAIHSVIIASRNKYNSCKGLILISPYINEKIIDKNYMKNIICQTLLIKERVEKKGKLIEDETIAFYREITNIKEWFPKIKKISENNKTLFNDEDILATHRKKFINYIREFMKSDNNEKIICTVSRKSTNVETLLDNTDNYLEDLENKIDEKYCNDNNNKNIQQKQNYLKEFEEEDNSISYNNDDY